MYTKIQQTIDLLKNNPHWTRKFAILEIARRLDMSQAGASTYYYNAKKSVDGDKAKSSKDEKPNSWARDEAERASKAEKARKFEEKLREQIFGNKKSSHQNNPQPIVKKSWAQILGVSNVATKAEINAAWRRLVVQHHPDIHGGDHRLIAEINNARDVALKAAVA